MKTPKEKAILHLEICENQDKEFYCLVPVIEAIDIALKEQAKQIFKRMKFKLYECEVVNQFGFDEDALKEEFKKWLK